MAMGVLYASVIALRTRPVSVTTVKMKGKLEVEYDNKELVYYISISKLNENL